MEELVVMLSDLGFEVLSHEHVGDEMTFVVHAENSLVGQFASLMMRAGFDQTFREVHEHAFKLNHLDRLVNSIGSAKVEITFHSSFVGELVSNSVEVVKNSAAILLLLAGANSGRGKGALAYICAPYEGGPRSISENVDYAKSCARFVAEEHGWIPVTPQVMFGHVYDEDDRDGDMDACFHVLDVCGLIAVFGLLISSGMVDEILKAWKAETDIVWIGDAC